MEMQANIVIVGAGIAGLATAVGLYRLGLTSLVLEASNDLRVTGFAFTSWVNAWRALDALGVGHLLREKRPRIQALNVVSTVDGKTTSQISLIPSRKGEMDYEVRCVERKMLIKTLAAKLPKGSIRFSSKVVSIEESNQHWKRIHLDDGSTLNTKVLIGCDGINSIVGRWLGLKNPKAVGKTVIRGHLITGTPVEPNITQYMGGGVKYGIVPINTNSLYWFLTFTDSRCNDKEVERNPQKMKEIAVSKLGKGSEKIRELIEKTDVKDVICSPLKFRVPWEVLWGEITKENVCVVGDAFHPMTPDLGQGACSTLEDAVVLARNLSQAMLARGEDEDEEKEYERIKKGLKEYVKQRRWRAFSLMITGYVVGYIEVVSSKPLQLFRDRVLAPYLNLTLLKMGDYDCGLLI